MSVLRRVLPLVCCALLLIAVSALGQSAKKPGKKKPPAPAAPCGHDPDGNPIPPANCVVPPPATVQQPAAAAAAAAGNAGNAKGATIGTGTAGNGKGNGNGATTGTGSGSAGNGQQPADPTPPPVCTSTDLGEGDSINIPPAVVAGGDATFSLKNPIPKTATEIKASWITKQPNASAPANVSAKPFPFSLGFCGPDKDKKPLTQYFDPGSDFAELKTAEAIVIRFVPNQTGKFTSSLQLTWKDNTEPKKYTVIGDGGAADYAKDSRYKLWAYTGFTFLRSQNNFSDSFAELLVRVETRWIDERIAMKQHDSLRYENAKASGKLCDWNAATSTWDKDCSSAVFGIVRLYGEAGLTGTTASATGTASTASLGGAQESFTGAFGLGFGATRLVSTLKPDDTGAFSLLFVPRLGLTSIPAQPNHPETAFTAYDYSANIRIENEPGLDPNEKAGNFEGAYFEFGAGESERYSRKKFPRLRADGYVPIPGGSDLFRFALRLQIDAPRPFAKKKNDPTDPSDNLANEIRISALFNLNLLELGKRMSGSK